MLMPTHTQKAYKLFEWPRFTRRQARYVLPLSRAAGQILCEYGFLHPGLCSKSGFKPADSAKTGFYAMQNSTAASAAEAASGV